MKTQVDGKGTVIGLQGPGAVTVTVRGRGEKPTAAARSVWRSKLAAQVKCLEKDWPVLVLFFYSVTLPMQ